MRHGPTLICVCVCVRVCVSVHFLYGDSILIFTVVLFNASGTLLSANISLSLSQ